MKFPKLETRGDNIEFKSPKFLRVTEGEMVIRILGPSIYDVKTHWVAGVTVKCLGEDCPICANNDKIRLEHPEDFRDIAGYIPWRNSFYTNVYDKSPVKVCENCDSEVQQVRGIFPSACWKCDTIVTSIEAQPSNTVKILNRGVQLRDQLELVNNSVVGDDGEPVGLETFDIRLRVGSNKEPIPIEMPESNEPIELEEDALYELERVPLRLDVEELKDLLRGVKVKDILIARGISNEEEVIKEKETDVQKASKKVRSIFKG